MQRSGFSPPPAPRPVPPHWPLRWRRLAGALGAGSAPCWWPAARASRGARQAAPPPGPVAQGAVSVQQVYEQARGAVVNVTTGTVALDQLRQPQVVAAGTGTGVIYDPRGYILTNSHVVQDPNGSGPSRFVRVALADGRVAEARVLADDPSNDLAILKIEAPDLQAARDRGLGRPGGRAAGGGHRVRPGPPRGAQRHRRGGQRPGAQHRGAQRGGAAQPGPDGRGDQPGQLRGPPAQRRRPR